MPLRPLSESNAQTLLAKINGYQSTIGLLKVAIRNSTNVAPPESLPGVYFKGLKKQTVELERDIGADQALIGRVKRFIVPQIKVRLRREFEALRWAAKDLTGRVDKASKTYDDQHRLDDAIVRLRQSSIDPTLLIDKAKGLIKKYPDMSLSYLEQLSTMMRLAKQREKAIETQFTAEALDRFQKEIDDAKGNNEKLKAAVGRAPREVRDKIYEAICKENQHGQDREWAKRQLHKNVGIIRSAVGAAISSKGSSSSHTSFSHNEFNGETGVGNAVEEDGHKFFFSPLDTTNNECNGSKMHKENEYKFTSVETTDMGDNPEKSKRVGESDELPMEGSIESEELDESSDEESEVEEQPGLPESSTLPLKTSQVKENDVAGKLQKIIDSMTAMKADQELIKPTNRHELQNRMHTLFNENMQEHDKISIYREIGKRARFETEHDAIAHGRLEFASNFDLVLELTKNRLKDRTIYVGNKVVSAWKSKT